MEERRNDLNGNESVEANMGNPEETKPNFSHPGESGDQFRANPGGSAESNRQGGAYAAESNRPAEPYSAESNRPAGPYSAESNRPAGPYSAESNRSAGPYSPGYQSGQSLSVPKKKKKGLKLFLLIAGIFAVLVFLLVFFGSSGGSSDVDYVPVYSDHIAVVDIVDTISMDGGDYSDAGYNQTWLLNTIEGLTCNSSNQGLVLYLDTPGGSVYAADEVFLKLQEYKETGRPIYAYFGPTAASAGYYIAMNADQIYANRNTITGSIGVTMGTYFDVSELLDKLGVKTYTPVTGANKDLGSNVSPMTDQQKAILQSIIDESYHQFLDAICESRGMDKETLIPIADGRVYTAQQALKLGLIDEIGSLDDTVNAMMEELNIGETDVISYSYTPEISVWDLLLGAVENLQKSAESDDPLKTALKLMEQNKPEPMYLMVP